MKENTMLYHKVCILGVGLIGGSIGIAIKKLRLAHEVVGVSRQHGSLVQALKARAIDRASHDIKKSVQDADLVILATPVQSIVTIIAEIKNDLKRGCLVTDVGSTKSQIVDAAQKNFPSHVLFAGSHPLAGSEKKGALNASAELLQQACCIVTPTNKTNRTAVDKIKHLWTKLGSRVTVMTPDEHDKILASVSHLPHVLAYNLMSSIPAEHLTYATQGLRDSTRIALSDPEMWRDVCLTNSRNILKSLDQYVKALANLRKLIAARSEEGLLDVFKRSKNLRDGINKS